MASTNGADPYPDTDEEAERWVRTGSSISDARRDSGPRSPRPSPTATSDQWLDEPVALDIVNVTGPKATPALGVQFGTRYSIPQNQHAAPS